jgi:hypothetical protein
MSDDLFRDPFVLQVIRATLVSNGIPGERLDDAVDKVVRACVERVRRGARAPADVGQATAIALTVVNAAAGRARARPGAGAATPKEPGAPESVAPPAAIHGDRTSEEVQRPQVKAPRRRKATVVWIAAGIVAALAGAAALVLGSLRPRGDAPSAPSASSVGLGPAPSLEGDASAEAMPSEAIAAEVVEAGAEDGARATDAAGTAPVPMPDAAEEPAP